MRIIVDNDIEKQLIISLCDVALKAGGVRNLKETEKILASIEDAETSNQNIDKDK